MSLLGSIDLSLLFEIFVTIVTIIGFSSTVAATTPTPRVGTIWSLLYRIFVDTPALNVLFAKDK